jgi:hypothetical protein
VLKLAVYVEQNGVAVTLNREIARRQSSARQSKPVAVGAAARAESAHEHAEETEDGLELHSRNSVGMPVVAAFTAVVYPGQNELAMVLYRYSAMKQLSLLQIKEGRVEDVVMVAKLVTVFESVEEGFPHQPEHPPMLSVLLEVLEVVEEESLYQPEHPPALSVLLEVLICALLKTASLSSSRA